MRLCLHCCSKWMRWLSTSNRYNYTTVHLFSLWICVSFIPSIKTVGWQTRKLHSSNIVCFRYDNKLLISVNLENQRCGPRCVYFRDNARAIGPDIRLTHLMRILSSLYKTVFTSSLVCYHCCGLLLFHIHVVLNKRWTNSVLLAYKNIINTHQGQSLKVAWHNLPFSNDWLHNDFDEILQKRNP